MFMDLHDVTAMLCGDFPENGDVRTILGLAEEPQIATEVESPEGDRMNWCFDRECCQLTSARYSLTQYP